MTPRVPAIESHVVSRPEIRGSRPSRARLIRRCVPCRDQRRRCRRSRPRHRPSFGCRARGRRPTRLRRRRRRRGTRACPFRRRRSPQPAAIAMFASSLGGAVTRPVVAFSPLSPFSPAGPRSPLGPDRLGQRPEDRDRPGGPARLEGRDLLRALTEFADHGWRARKYLFAHSVCPLDSNPSRRAPRRRHWLSALRQVFVSSRLLPRGPSSANAFPLTSGLPKRWLRANRPQALDADQFEMRSRRLLLIARGFRACHMTAEFPAFLSSAFSTAAARSRRQVSPAGKEAKQAPATRREFPCLSDVDRIERRMGSIPIWRTRQCRQATGPGRERMILAVTLIVGTLATYWSVASADLLGRL